MRKGKARGAVVLEQDAQPRTVTVSIDGKALTGHIVKRICACKERTGV